MQTWEWLKGSGEKAELLGKAEEQRGKSVSVQRTLDVGAHRLRITLLDTETLLGTRYEFEVVGFRPPTITGRIAQPRPAYSVGMPVSVILRIEGEMPALQSLEAIAKSGGRRKKFLGDEMAFRNGVCEVTVPHVLRRDDIPMLTFDVVLVLGEGGGHSLRAVVNVPLGAPSEDGGGTLRPGQRLESREEGAGR